MVGGCITEVNGKGVDKTLDKSQLQNGDNVVIKFGGKSKKLLYNSLLLLNHWK